MVALGAPPLVADFAIVIIGAAILGYLCQRVHLESIVGFLLTGAIVGPNALALIEDQEVVDGMAEIGVIFLMFAIGLELSGERLRKMGALMLGGGALQVGLTIAMVTGLCSLWNIDIKTGIYTGCLVALSSTAVVLKLLSSRGATESQTGQIAVAFLIFQDIAVVVMVLLVPILGGEGGGVGDIAGALSKAAAVIVALLVGSKFIVPPFLDAVKRYADDEAFLFAVLAIAAGFAWLVTFFGISASLGAFIGGLVVSSGEHRHQAAQYVAPFQMVFAAVFFASIGEFSFVLQKVGVEAGLSVAGQGADGDQAFIATTVVLIAVTPALYELAVVVGGRVLAWQPAA
jgi:CPA2 family monovalent cation:H+ antiporter-2